MGPASLTDQADTCAVVAYVVAAAFAGLLAAIAPARRAAKMSMLTAIAAE